MSEARDLEARDLHLDSDRPTLVVRQGKGRKARVVPAHVAQRDSAELPQPVVGTRPDSDHTGLPGAGAGSVRESSLGTLIHTLGVGLEDALPAVRGEIVVGHQKYLVTGLALAKVLDLLVNEKDPYLTSRPKNRVHLSDEWPQHLCLDKGYDNPTGHRTVAAHEYRGHIRRIGEEKLDAKGVKRYPARRWVVERTLAWLSKCRAILVRYDKKASNYMGLIQLACALLWYRRQWQLKI